MFCGSCGWQRDNSARFCPHCGSALGDPQPASASATITLPDQADPRPQVVPAPAPATPSAVPTAPPIEATTQRSWLLAPEPAASPPASSAPLLPPPEAPPTVTSAPPPLPDVAPWAPATGPGARLGSGPPHASWPAPGPRGSLRSTADGRRRSVAWVYYAVLSVIGFFLAITTGTPGVLLPAILAGLYSVYLFRGGRFVLWIW